MRQVEPILIHREMGISDVELFRLLDVALQTSAYSVTDDLIIIESGDQHLEIRFSVEEPRHLGSLRLPITMLEFRFSGYTSDEVEQRMAHFDRTFHRSGG